MILLYFFARGTSTASWQKNLRENIRFSADTPHVCIKRLQDLIFHPIMRGNLREIDVCLFAEIHSVDEGLSIALALKAEDPVAPRETNRKREREREKRKLENVRFYWMWNDAVRWPVVRQINYTKNVITGKCVGALKIARCHEYSAGERSLPHRIFSYVHVCATLINKGTNQ